MSAIPEVVKTPFEEGLRKHVNYPYCPFWCPYMCLGKYQEGKCLIRDANANKILKEVTP